MLNLENLLLVLALSLDAFVASIGYGTNRIKIPFSSILIISLLCSSSLGISLFLGSQFKKVLSGNLGPIISFIILILLGIYYLFEGILKSYLKDKSSGKVKIKLFNIWLIIDIYIDGTKADLNLSKTLDPKEALYLAIALSLDSLAVGFASSLGNVNYLSVIGLSIVVGIISIWAGLGLGKKLVEKVDINLSWLSGILLIILAVLKLI